MSLFHSLPSSLLPFQLPLASSLRSRPSQSIFLFLSYTSLSFIPSLLLLFENTFTLFLIISLYPPFLYQLSFNVFPTLLCHYKHLYIVSLNDFNISPPLSHALSPCWAYYITHEPRLCCLQNSGKLSKITQRGGITLLNKQRPFIVIRCIRIA